MFRFLLFVLVVGAVGLYLTNPTTDDVRDKINAQVATQTGAGVAVATPDAQPALPPAALPPAVGAAVTDKVQGEIQIERTNYYLFSVFKVSVGGASGKQLPGCVIGIAKQALPYDKC